MFGEVPLWATARKGSSRDSTTNWQNNFNFGFPKKKYFNVFFTIWKMIRNVIMLSMNGQGSRDGSREGRGWGEWALTFIYCVRQLQPGILLLGNNLAERICHVNCAILWTVAAGPSNDLPSLLPLPATVAHRSYFMWLSWPDLLWLPAGTFLHPPLSLLPALSLFICVDAQKG